jgi:hypothetical protein
LAPPAGAVMIVTVPALTALESGNVHRVVSGENDGCWLVAGGGTAGVVWAAASCKQKLAAAAASAILVRDPIHFSLARANSMARRGG